MYEIVGYSVPTIYNFSQEPIGWEHLPKVE
jgi:hypothetical protein